eukprot:TRINITY_DN27805_c0_g1_i1.p1 TRINITY_DN27805_c0_g1~~TRINITY_DN27805_c0_g1_i1.p1  ORF type:complete len:336 (-),score=28.37 TRINITY_DN27805_c0_g1_i1:104-1012(-)
MAETIDVAMIWVGLPLEQRGEIRVLTQALQGVAAICFCIQWFVYAVHAAPLRSDKYFDFTGACTYAVAVVYSFVSSDGGPWSATWRRIFVSAAVLCWCGRLGTFLFRRIRRDGHDRRLNKFKANRLLFLGTWNMQGSWCFFVGLPAYMLNCLPALASPQPLAATDIIGLTVWAAGWVLQIVADNQKYAFRNDPTNKERFICTGLWAWSRHPNYFGEMSLWCGLALIAQRDLYGYGALTRCLVGVSPVFTVGLLSFVSGLPLLERYADKKWGGDPAYVAYKRRTPLLLPFPPFLTSSTEKKSD